MCSRLGAALCVVGGTLLLLSMQHYASHHGSRQARQFHGEAHQQVEVDSSLKTLRGLATTIRGGRASIKARLVADDCEVPAGAKKVHLIRHGEGVHNVAQREWRSRPEYDGRSEPYTVDNDPSGKYTDALLTPAGEAQARALQPRTQQLSPQLLVVSPLRRAAAWSKCRLGSARARPLRLLRARLAALGSSALPGRGRVTGRPATASGSRVGRLQGR